MIVFRTLLKLQLAMRKRAKRELPEVKKVNSRADGWSKYVSKN
jgi:hypothetical protein